MVTMLKSKKSTKLLEKLNKVLSIDRNEIPFKKKAFTRKRIFTIETMLLALLVSAQAGFNIGYKHLISKLFMLGAISRKKKILPCDKSFEKALDKLPLEAVTSLISKSHDLEFSDGGNTLSDK